VTGAPAPCYLSVDECAALLAVDHKTIRRLIEREKLPALKVGRLWRINPADLERLRYHAPEAAAARRRRRRPRPTRGEFARRARSLFGSSLLSGQLGDHMWRVDPA
jgi:excisionase family DNA binding protein